MESSFRKLVLVNPETVTSHYKPTPTEKKLSLLDKDISEILTSDMPDDEKAKRYISALTTHNLLSASRLKPVDAETEILSNIQPPQEKTRARELLKLIRPYLSWNDDGEIVVNNRVIPFTNISDLLSNLMTSTVKKPEGWDEISTAISTANVPQELIRNKRRWKDITKRRDSPASLATPKSSKTKRRTRRELEWDEQS